MKLSKNQLKVLFRSFMYIIVPAMMLSCSEDIPVNTYNQSPSIPASQIDADYALEWMDIEYRIIADQHNDSPPPPSRLYAYTCVTIYESVAPGIPQSRSLSGQLNEMPVMPQVNQSLEYDWPSVIAAAVKPVLYAAYDTLYPGSVVLVENHYNDVLAERRTILNEEIINRSIEHGLAISEKIKEWISTDGYDQTRNMTYIPPPRTENPANWEPINPGDRANEPYWGTLRPFVVRNPEQFFIAMPGFSIDTSSRIYQDARELIEIKNNLTTEHKQIANFWNDKIRTGTPSGHWVSIMSQIARQLGLKLDGVAKMYAYMGPMMADGFIVCWKAKYHYNLLRPQSYIRDYIDVNWNPFLITPPFPAYPSGHSSLSGGCAEIMTELFGDVQFTDYTHQQIGYPPRSFTTFSEVAEEAAYSRLYGGIHYRFDSDNGLQSGHILGRWILNNIRLSLMD
jgi:hypothetical protein